MANPFLVGYHIRTKHGSSRVLQQDAFVSSVLVLITLLCLGVSCSIAHWTTLDHQTVAVSKSTVEGVLVVFMLVAIAIMTRLRCSQSPAVRALYRDADRTAAGTLSLSQESGGQSLEDSALQRRIRKILPLIGITIFYIIGAVHDILRIFAHAKCMPFFLECSLGPRYGLSIFFHVVRLLFMGSEVIFCYHFHDKVFRKTAAIRYALVFIMVATFTVLIDSILYDSQEIFNTPDVTHITCTIPAEEIRGGVTGGYNVTSGYAITSGYAVTAGYALTEGHARSEDDNATVLLTECLWENTPLYDLLEVIDPFLYPLNIEFLLLVSEVLVHLFCSLRVFDKTSDERDSSPSEGDDVIGGETEVDRTSDTTQSRDVESDGVSRRARSTAEDPGGNGRRCTDPDLPGIRNDVNRVQKQIDRKLRELAAILIHSSRSENASRVRELRRELAALDQNLAIQGAGATGDFDAGSSGYRPRYGSDTRSVTSETGRRILSNGHVEEGQRLIQDSSSERNSYGSMTLSGMTDSLTQRCQRQPPTSDRPSSDSDESETSHFRPRGVQAYLVCLCVLSNLIFLSLGILTYVDQADGLYVAFHIAYWVLLVGVSVMGFHFCNNLKSHYHDFHGLEVMVILMTFSTSLYCFLHLTATISTLMGSQKRPEIDPESVHSYGYSSSYSRETWREISHETSPETFNEHNFSSNMPWLALFDKLLNLVQLYMQTCFMFLAARVCSKRAARRDRTGFKVITLVLAASNFTLWLMDTTVDMKNIHLDPVQNAYYLHQTWHIMVHLLMPLFLFYRFNSFIIFLEIFLEQ